MSCNNLISNAEVEYAYNDEKFIISNQVISNCVDNNIKKVFIEIYDEDNITLLEKPIERLYFREKELFSNINQIGKVAKHEYFILKDIHQNKGIAKKVHERELEIYRRNNFIEIQLDAAWDGLIVWKKLFYKFANSTQENLVKIAIQRYLREVKNMTLEEIDKTIKINPFSINSSYLKDSSNPNNDFKHWVYNNCKGIGLAKMYKEITV